MEQGIWPTVICAPDRDLCEYLPGKVQYIPVDFTRQMSLWSDIKVLWQLVKIFRKNRYSLVQYSTPKAALIGSIAGFLAGIPLRLYLIWGLYFEGQNGIKRYILQMFEKITCLFSTHVLPNSKEMRDYLVENRYSPSDKCHVIHNGSACGIDCDIFKPQDDKTADENLYAHLKIPSSAIILGYFGRLTGDKGINELVAAFSFLSEKHKSLYLLIIGLQEEKDRLRPETVMVMKSNQRIIHLPYQKSLVPYYNIVDIYCLPTYREGFPQTLLEAQAMELPVVATNIRGCREAMRNGCTGILAEPRNVASLVEAIDKIICEPQLREVMGRNGRQWVKENFETNQFIQSAIQNHLQLLSSLPTSKTVYQNK